MVQASGEVLAALLPSTALGRCGLVQGSSSGAERRAVAAWTVSAVCGEAAEGGGLECGTRQTQDC